MIKILFTLICIGLIAQALASHYEKERERDRDKEDKYEHENLEKKFHDPCRGECGCKKTKSVYFTDKVRQEITESAHLTCTPDSYFEKITYEGCYKLNTTCYGLVHEKVNREKGIYIGYRRHGDKEDERKVEIDGAPYKTTWTFTAGNIQRLEEAKLAGCDECESYHGHLYALAQYVADEPVEGCCKDDRHKGGVKEFTAVAYKLRIYGKYYSTCYLQAATIKFSERVRNKQH